MQLEYPVKSARLIALIALLVPGHALANKTVTSPYVHADEAEIEWKGGYDIGGDDEQDGNWTHIFEASYGITAFWQTEFEAEIEHEDGEGTDLSDIAWDNKFQLTGKDEFWVDVGAKFKYELNTSGDADAIEGKLLLGKEWGRFRHLANLGLETEVGNDSSDDIEYDLSWSSKFNHSETFQPGFEYYAEFGPLDESTNFDEQDHRLGPVAYGTLFETVGYEVGVLFGLSDEAPDATLKAVLAYEWHF